MTKKSTRKWLPLIAVGLTSVAGAFASTGFFSQQAAVHARATTQDLNALFSSNGLALEEVSYQQGLLSSVQELRLTPNDPTMNLGSFLIVNRIQHGPLPGSQTIETEIIPEDPEQKAIYDKLFPKEKPVAKTMFGKMNRTTFSIPEVNQEMDGVTIHSKHSHGVLNWSPPVKVDGTSVLKNIVSEFTIPEISIKSEDNVFLIKGMKMTEDSQGTLIAGKPSNMRIGKSQMTIDEININTLVDMPFMFKNIKIDSDTRMKNEFFEVISTTSIPQMILGHKSFTNAVFNTSMHNLHAQSLEKINKIIIDAQSIDQMNDKQEKEMEAAVTKLLSYSPEIKINEISLNNSELKANGHIGFVAKPGTKMSQISDPYEAMNLISSQFKLSMSKGILNNFLNIPNKTDQDHTKEINGLVESGMFTFANNKLNWEIKMIDGEVYINGKKQ